MRKIISFTLLLWMLLVPVWAEETEPEPTEAAAEAIQIHTPQDLSAMAQEPNGDYILAEDLDMAGEEWMPFAFSGTLDGNGHSILNLTLSEPGAEIITALDGN